MPISIGGTPWGQHRDGKGDLPPLLLRLTNLLGYLFLILVNVLSSTGALGGTNADVSGRFPTPLTPAGWAFAIWGFIFILEGCGVLYQIINNGYREGGWKTSVVTKIGYGWQLGWLFQDLWQFLFVRESVLGMWFAAGALIGAFASFLLTLQRLNGMTHELRSRGFAAMPASVYVCYKLPTAINAAWLSVATALGLLIVPVAHGVHPDSLVAPAAVLTVAVTAGGVWRLASHRDAAYGLTLIWALSAVAANSSGNVPTAVKAVGIACLVVLALFVVSALVRTHREHSSAAEAGGLGTGMDGSLLHNTYGLMSYGPYGGNQRAPLSDSPDAPAGCGPGRADSFTFPTTAFHGSVIGSGSGSGRRYGAAAAGGVAAPAGGHKPPALLHSAPGLERGGKGVVVADGYVEAGPVWPRSPRSSGQVPAGAVVVSGKEVAAPPQMQYQPAPQGSPRGAAAATSADGPAANRRVRFSDEEAAE